MHPKVETDEDRDRHIQHIKDHAESFKTIVRMRCFLLKEQEEALRLVDDVVTCVIKSIEDVHDLR